MLSDSFNTMRFADDIKTTANDMQLITVPGRLSDYLEDYDGRENREFGQKGNDYLRQPECRTWCVGIFCLKGYERQIAHVCKIDPEISLASVGLSEDKLNAWGPGRIRCTWPEFHGESGPPEDLEHRKIVSESVSSEPRDLNFQKILQAIQSEEKRENVNEAVKDARGMFGNYDGNNSRIKGNGSRINCFNYKTLHADKRTRLMPICQVFATVEFVFNIIFDGTGIAFDMEDVTKTERFYTAQKFNQLNVRILSSQFKRHVYPGNQHDNQGSQQPAAVDPKHISLRNIIGDNTVILDGKHHNKTPPCVTLIVASGAYPELGGGYGAVRNCGINPPSNIDFNHYMGDATEDEKKKLRNMCSLQHYMILDECAKIGIDRQCNWHVGYDLTFWQANHVSTEPNFSKWSNRLRMPKMSVTNFSEYDMRRYPEMRYDKSKLVFNENKNPSVLYEFFCTTSDSLFETFPELHDNDKLVKVINNNKELEETSIRKLSDRLQKIIKERGKLFHDYLRHYDGYHEAPVSEETNQLLDSLVAKDINSCTIVRNITDSTQEAYEVKVDDLESGSGTDIDSPTFKLLMFPIYRKRFCGGDFLELRHCMLEFKHEIKVFEALKDCKYAGKMYDYGKMPYIDEYGNEKLKLFILKEKPYGRTPVEDDQVDSKMIDEALDALEQYCEIEELFKFTILAPVYDNVTPDENDDSKIHAGFIQDNFARTQGIEMKMDFRIVNGQYAKFFGFNTVLDRDIAGGRTWKGNRYNL